jgi:HK97 family phage major capsid protein
MKRLQEVLKRMKEIQVEVRDGNVSEELEKELDALIEEKNQIEARQKDLNKKFDEGSIVKVDFEDPEERDAQQIQAVYRSAYLKRLMNKQLTKVEERAITSATSSGGYAIPTETWSKIQEKMVQVSILYPRVNKLFVQGKLSLPIENVNSDASWVAEGAGGSDGTDTLDDIAYGAYDLIKLQTITAQMSTMSIDDFEAWLVRVMAKKMARAIDKAIISGAGSGSNQPTGIENAVSWVDGTNATEIANAAAWTYDDIVEFLGILDAAHAQGAEVIINRKTLYGNIYKIKDSNGNPIFVPNSQDGNSGKLMGYPVTVFDQLEDDVMYFGNLENFTYNFNKDVEIAHDDSVGFTKATRTYRAHALVDGHLLDTSAFAKLYVAAV